MKKKILGIALALLAVGFMATVPMFAEDDSQSTYNRYSQTDDGAWISQQCYVVDGIIEKDVKTKKSGKVVQTVLTNVLNVSARAYVDNRLVTFEPHEIKTYPGEVSVKNCATIK